MNANVVLWTRVILRLFSVYVLVSSGPSLVYALQHLLAIPNASTMVAAGAASTESVPMHPWQAGSSLIYPMTGPARLLCADRVSLWVCRGSSTQCPGCGHDVRSLPPGPCPECGCTLRVKS